MPDIKKPDIKNAYEKLFEKSKGKKIVIYGAGVMCSELINELSKYSIKANGIAVTCVEENLTEYENLPVTTIDNFSCDDIILIAIKDPHTSFAIKNTLLSKGYKKIVEFDFTHGLLPNIEDITKELI